MCLCTVCDYYFFSVAECAERERLYVKTKNRVYLIFFFFLVLIQVFVYNVAIKLLFLSFLHSFNRYEKKKKTETEENLPV